MSTLRNSVYTTEQGNDERGGGMKDPLLLPRSLLNWLSVTEFYALFITCVSVGFIVAHIHSQLFAYSYHIPNNTKKSPLYGHVDMGFVLYDKWHEIRFYH